MRTALRDGSQITIRPVEPDDRTALAEGFERLSPESRYRRFFGPMPELSERDLTYLTRVDHHDHEALVAVDGASGDGVGVARYVRVAPGVAEPAIVVQDEWQGRGVATLLLDALADRARDEGIARFEAPVLAENSEAIRVLERLGATSSTSSGREVELSIDLSRRPDQPAPARWPGLLRQFALGALEPARSFAELVFPRRRGAPGDPRRNVIVVATDGSDEAGAAVEAAAELASASGAAVDVVGAHHFVPTDREEIEAAVRGAAAELRGRGLHVHEHVRRGDPALVITDLAGEQEARLIVLGAGGRGKAARRLIGSVADFVSERSPCDVLIVREPAYSQRK